jgi:peptide-methionine (S)-S-oxide reductase
VVSYEELTKVFFTSHDPTTKNSQGPDHGSSYRSILFYLTAEEKAIAEKSLESFEKSGLYKTPIVSEIKKLTEFYRAEGYHQDFIAHNPNQSYVRGVSIPRFELFKKTYKGKLK